MAKITLKTLAEGLQMSVSTVSKALNDSYEISEETKNKVKAYAKLHKYEPNIIAKTLKTGKTHTIGVVIPKMSTPFESQILEGIQRTAHAFNYHIIIMNSLENEAVEKASINAILAKGVDGILFCPIHEDSNTALVQEIAKKLPFVIFDRTNYPLNTHKVGVSNAEGTAEACRHLLLQGHRHIAVLCGSHQGLTAERLTGYKKAYDEAALSINQDHIVYLNVKSLPELHIGLEANIKRLLQLKTPPTAILGVSDTITTHALGILAKLEIKVPAQLAVIGFANTELAFSLNPSLSTIRQPAHEIGKVSFLKLLEILNTKYKDQIDWEDIKLPTVIELRNSTKSQL